MLQSSSNNKRKTRCSIILVGKITSVKTRREALVYVIVGVKFLRNVWSEDFLSKLFGTKVALRLKQITVNLNAFIDVVFGMCHFLYQDGENCLVVMFMDLPKDLNLKILQN